MRYTGLNIRITIYLLLKLLYMLVCDVGMTPSLMPQWCLLSSHFGWHWHYLILTKAIDIQPSIIAYIAKSLAHVSKGERHTAHRICEIAYEHFHSSHITLLLLTKVCIFNLGFQPASHPHLGYCHVYGQRAPQCYIPHGRSHHHSSIQLNMLYDSGTCILHYYTMGITTDIPERLKCILSRGTRTWNAATTGMPYSRLSVHVRDYKILGNHCLWWSHWQVS